MGRSTLEDDPLSLALAPPPNETPAQRQAREVAEAQAKKISDEIDEQIRRERDGDKKKRRPVKLLLLGQSESGKTATLKNFQLTYARRVWTEERNAWRSVIFLNLLKNVNEIMSDMTREMAAGRAPNSESSSSEDSDPGQGRDTSKRPPLRFKEHHRVLQLRLGPLKRVQHDLERRLGAGATELYSTDVDTAAPFGEPYSSTGRKVLQEFSINSTNGWKSALEKLRARARTESQSGTMRKLKDKEDDTADILAGCKDDIKAIYDDPTVKEMLNRRKTRIEDGAGFFLNDVERIASADYQPSDDDIVRARLRTLGVQEYKFVFEHGRSVGQEWRLYDVGGTRSSRAAWYPYFEDVDAIIFLAPISCFDEKLIEDRKVNRLEDSFLLWRSVCSCKLLARTQIILFLNKCDLLQAKLMRGVKIRDYVPSFGNRSNDLTTATKYFQQHFREILKQYSPVPRTFYPHLTSVIDTRSTAVTLGVVEESILRDHLRRADLIT